MDGIKYFSFYAALAAVNKHVCETRKYILSTVFISEKFAKNAHFDEFTGALNVSYKFIEREIPE